MTIDSAPGPRSDESAARSGMSPPPNEPPARPWVEPRRERFLVSFLVIVVAAIAMLQAMAPGPALPADVPSPGERLDLLLQGRYTLGAAVLFERLGPIGEAQAIQLAGSLEAFDATPAARLCLAPVFDELGDPEAAARARAVAPSALDGDAALAARALRGGGAALDDAEIVALREYCGWFGELALARMREDGDALVDLRADAARLALVFLAVALLGLGALVFGGAIAALAGLRLRQGALTSGYRRDLARAGADVPGAARVAYLETTVFFLLGLQVLGVVTALLMQAGVGIEALLVQWAIVPLLLWPLRRGETRATLAAALGWSRPRSVVGEVAWGLVAYLAAAPLLALGLIGSIVVSRFVSQPPYHPVMDWVRDGEGALAVAVLFVIASAWAPLVEETVFRGGLYHYLRGRFGVVASATLVALIFAAIHPQGLVGVPFLLALAVALAITREWRGSMIARVTMHAVHNALAVGFLIVVLGGV